MTSQPYKLKVVIAFHYVEERLKYLKGVLESLSQFDDNYVIDVMVQTHQFGEGLAKLVNEYDPMCAFEVIGNLKDPYMLTWSHKARMETFLDSDYTHFIYLEDDMQLTQENMEYWLETKDYFRSRNTDFIPAFVRVEYKNDGEAMAIDMKGPPTGIGVDFGDRQFVSLDQFYQGMFIMDRDMVEKHVKSPSFKFETSRPIPGTFNDVRERANQGNMYVDVHEGFHHSLLVPHIEGKSYWILHNAGNYIPMENTLHGKFPISRLFENFK